MKAKQRLAIYGGALLMLGATCAAGTTDFQPSVAADTTYSDNLEYSGTGSSSDAAYRLSLDLPVTRTWATGQMLFRYNPRRNQFRDQGALDHTAHFAQFAINDQLSDKGW